MCVSVNVCECVCMRLCVYVYVMNEQVMYICLSYCICGTCVFCITIRY